MHRHRLDVVLVADNGLVLDFRHVLDERHVLYLGQQLQQREVLVNGDSLGYHLVHGLVDGAVVRYLLIDRVRDLLDHGHVLHNCLHLFIPGNTHRNRLDSLAEKNIAQHSITHDICAFSSYRNCEKR